jgi:LmbE family N-acetylglucosaminyl deacetylase
LSFAADKLRVAALVTGLAGMIACAQLCHAGEAVAANSGMPALSTRDRLLIIAPHPDDESLCCAGLIQQAQRSGAQVAIVWVTNGDGFEIDAMVAEHTLRPHGKASLHLGEKRLREAHAAADLLGVPRAQQYVLGYPDRDIRALLEKNDRSPLRSTYTRVSAVATAEALHPGAAYTGQNLRRDLDTVIASFAPTLVLAAAPQDLHSDHTATGQLALSLLAARGQADRLRYWIVHAGRGWPRPRRYRPELALAVPARAQSLTWSVVPLSAAQVERKRAAILLHRSQMEVMAPFLLSFARRNELFALPGPSSTPGQPVP